jgi:4-amino-4-deoxy-L-arabinose transferase-like glycosyltransferase
VIFMKTIHDHIPAGIFWSVAVLLSLAYLGATELTGPEDRWAEIVREMRLTGDYFHPRINGDPYFDKPLLSYWLIAGASVVTGRLDERTVRLPSAIAGLVGLAATIHLGRRLWSESLARAAGWILLSTYGFLSWARAGEADMENMAAVILAVGWYWARRDKPSFLTYLVFWLICFIGAQAKGMAAIAVPAIIILPDLVRAGRWRSYVSVSHALALSLGAMIYMAPLLGADLTQSGYNASGLGAAFKENVVRYFRPFDHKEPIYIYFYYLPMLFLPWIPLLVGGLWAAAGSFKRLDWPTKWLVISIALVFAFFTFSGSRRSYYILPILPLCALLSAAYLDLERQEKARSRVLAIQAGLLAGAAVVEAFSPGIWPIAARLTDFEPSRQLAAVTMILGVLGLLALIASQLRPGLPARIARLPASLMPLIIASVVLMGGFVVWQRAITGRYLTLKGFCTDLNSHVGNRRADVAFLDGPSGIVIFYLDLGRPARIIRSADDLDAFLSCRSDAKVLISRADSQDAMADVLHGRIAADATIKEKVYPWETETKKFRAWIILGEGT